MCCSTSNRPTAIYTASGTTDATGALTFTLPAGMFSTIFAVTAAAVRNSTVATSACFAQVVSYSTTSVVVQVFESKSTTASNNVVVEGLEKATAAIAVTLTVFGI